MSLPKTRGEAEALGRILASGGRRPQSGGRGPWVSEC